VLWFGWFGFNAGSAIVGPNCSDAAGGLAGLAMTTTMVAPAMAGLTWMIAEWIHAGKWIEYKTEAEVNPVRMRPVPLEFALYFDI
jgi:ammonia channel protein AmtB